MSPPIDIEEAEIGSLARVECLRARSPEALIGRVNDADALLVFHEVSIPSGVIDMLDRCRVIVRCGVGYDNVDLEAAGRRGIPVCNVPDYGVDEVADHAIALMLACHRGLLLAERRLREPLVPWNYLAVRPAFRLSEATMGIVGLGRTGTATAMRAKALKMRVLACDPYIPAGIDKAVGVQMADLDTLLRESDVVSLHVPLTSETRHLIDAAALSKMKPHAILVNTARGAVVDTDALAEALRAEQIAAAGIDVLPVEPPTPELPLIALWREPRERPVNLVLTPHSAFYSEGALAEMRAKGAREVARVLRGEPPRNCVNTHCLRR
jgi:D-3-phosphoglycerate dehydrogenase/C-terminal binding protein